MEALIARLIAVLEKEEAAFQELLETMEREQQALLRCEGEPIAEVVGAQEALAKACANLEADRVRLVGALASKLREDPSSLTILHLIERVPDAQAERFRALRDSLLDLQEKIQHTNRNNALLIKQSMKYVDRSLRILTGAGPSSGVYVQSGKIETRSSPLQAMVNRVA